MFTDGSQIKGSRKRFACQGRPIAGVTVDAGLVDALMEDAPQEDALPLLAFALQHLWHQYASSGSLTKDHYAKVGGLRGLIEDAAERALRGIEPGEDVPLPCGPPSNARIDLAASTFIPALAETDEEGATVRHLARWSSFTEAQQELLARFDRWRLIVRKGEADGGTVEVAHDALFRTWKRLESWLEPERARLESLRSLQVAAGNWERSAKDPAYLHHRSTRLAESRRLSETAGYAVRLIARDFDYLAACEVAEQAASAQARRGKVLVASLVALLAFSGVGFAYRQAIVREVEGQIYWQTQMGPSVLTAAEEKAKAAQPGSDFTECRKGCPIMIVVPAGAFTMGSPETEPARQNSERPRHDVTIAEPFAVSKFEVTFDDWDACTAAATCPSVSGPWGHGQMPVINVSWDDAILYVRWLSHLTGKEYRLLAEAEWEYAARAGTTTPYFWGDEVGEGNADCDGCGSRWDGKQAAPAGSFEPNAFGLYDTSGNVWEWCADPWHGTYDGAPTDGAPLGRWAELRAVTVSQRKCTLSARESLRTPVSHRITHA